MIISAPPYEAYPLSVHNDNDATKAKVHKLLNTLIQHETFFTDYERACDDVCGYCERCLTRKALVGSALLDLKAMCWEVWSIKEDGSLLDFVGILRLSRIRQGCDAVAHYFFFDGKLRDKTELLHAWRDWGFTDHVDWKALHRITLEIPSFAFSLGRHAQEQLGFGGPFAYAFKGKEYAVEGVKKDMILWRGKWHDELVMGLSNGTRSS